MGNAIFNVGSVSMGVAWLGSSAYVWTKMDWGIGMIYTLFTAFVFCGVVAFLAALYGDMKYRGHI